MTDEDLINNLYRVIASEIADGEVDDGIWLRALTETDNDDAKAKARYTKLRMAELTRDLVKAKQELEAGLEEDRAKEKEDIAAEEKRHKEAKRILDKAAKDIQNFTLFGKRR
jgi:hypothetical protein